MSPDSDPSRPGFERGPDRGQDLPAAGRLLGLDYGTKRVGVAISTPEQSIASPLETYHRRTLDRDAAYFLTLAKQNRIVGVVVGLPMHINGEEGVKAGEARQFGTWIGAITGLPVAYSDERFTSAVAEDMMRDAGLPRSKWKERIDKIAAQILLQAFLDARRGPEPFVEPASE